MIDNYKFYSSIRVNNDKVKKYLSGLGDVYALIPDTNGCLENISKENGCGGWCCRIQTPQLFYCEFLLIWQFVSQNWKDEEILDLFKKSMVCAVDTVPTKGCVFFDEKSCMCRIHKVRPFNCRIYAITPEEEFDMRYKKLKDRYKDIPWAVLKPQCKLVSTVNGDVITTKDTEDWFNRILNVESKIGISKSLMTDDEGGSYRSPHDHILLYNMPNNILTVLAAIRLYSKWEDKIATISEIISLMKDFFGKDLKDAH
jgi:Fe-S-cluster containining protein